MYALTKVPAKYDKNSIISEYNGWRGASVILAGIFLNMVICGALFRDLEWTKSLRDNHNHRSNTRKNDKLRRKTSSNSNRSCEQLSKSSLSSSPSRSSMPDIGKKRNMPLRKMNLFWIMHLHSGYDYSKRDIRWVIV